MTKQHHSLFVTGSFLCTEIPRVDLSHLVATAPDLRQSELNVTPPLLGASSGRTQVAVRRTSYPSLPPDENKAACVLRSGAVHWRTQPQFGHVKSYRIISFRIVSYHIVSYHIVSYRIVSYHIVSYHTISYHIISYCIVSYHIVSYHNIMYSITSYHTSYHIVSYHIVSYRIISYRIVS